MATKPTDDILCAYFGKYKASYVSFSTFLFNIIIMIWNLMVETRKNVIQTLHCLSSIFTHQLFFLIKYS